MKKEKYFLLFISILCCFSCASQKKEVIAKSSIKLEGENTNIRDLLDIDGVYAFSTMFFEDGTWVSFSMEKSDGKKIINFINYVETWKQNNQLRWGTNWGVYKILNDTIIVHSYDESTLFKGWSLEERRYKVVDRNTINLIYRKGLLNEEEKYYKMMNTNHWIDNITLHFIPVDSLPSSDNWLKEKKWIWRNESDWKAYMNNIKKNKK